MSGIKKSFDLELTQNDVTTLTDDELGVCDGIAITSASTNTEEIRISNRGDVAADKGTPLLPGKTALIKKIDPRNLGLFTTGASHSVSVSIGAEIEILGSDASGGGGGGGSGDASLAEQQAQTALLTGIDAGIPNALGQSNMAGSLSVAIASNQTTLPVSIAATVNVETELSATGALATDASVDGIETLLGTGNTNTSNISAKLPTLATATPATSASAIPVRQVPGYTPGSLHHVSHTSSITNAPNKLLFGFTNASGGDIFVEKIHAINAQTATHSGTLARLQIQSGSSAITGGTTVTGVSSPALVVSSRNPTLSGPSGLTWNTAGTLGGTVRTVEQCWWSTDEVTPNGTGVANDIAAKGVYQDIFDFRNDPIVVPNGYSLAVVCDSTAGWNGAIMLDFNIYQ
jgi:hypothetical protein